MREGGPSLEASRSGLARGIDSLLLASVGERPGQPALILGDQELSYLDLDALVDRVCGRLCKPAASDGQERRLAGTRVVVIAPNVPALVVGMFAAWRAGAVAVPLTARLREYELTEILRDADPAAVVAVAAHRGYSLRELLERLAPRIPTLRECLILDANGEVEAELPGAARPAESETLDPDIAAILYTSGTTGAPKGVLVEHARELGSAQQLAALLRLTPADTSIFVIPISHAFGFTCLLATLAAGSRAVLVESTFSPGPTLRAVELHGASVVHGSPALFISLLKAAPQGFPTLRTGFVAGAPCPPEVLERLDDTGARILNLYGTTEIGAAASCRPEDPPEVRHTTVGRPLAGVELRIASGGAAEAAGDLLVRGPSVTPGYFRRPEQTAEAFADDWFRTGDVGRLDSGGNLHITGRAKEVVHVGGFTIFPAEIEGFLLTHPDVLHAAVVGVSHEKMGEVLHAFVVARPDCGLTPLALLQFARGKIADYKLPYGATILGELPLLASGKPDRVALRELAKESRRGAAGTER